MNLPNKLTLFRIFLIPLIVLIMVFPYAQVGIAIPYFQVQFVIVSLKDIGVLVLFTIASITDFFDGYIARKRNLVTTFGKFLDPIADKLLVNTLLILFAVEGRIPVVPVLIMIWRDSLVDGIRMMVSGKGVVLAAGYLGKVKTVLQMLTVILVLLNNLPFELYRLPVASFLVWLSTLVSVFSGVSYFIQSKNVIMESR